MRRLIRPALEVKDKKYLHVRQRRANTKQSQNSLIPQTEWEGTRKTIRLKSVLSTLQKMMGVRERCMYCLDSHGSDIEHFWPKAPYPDKMFQWTNMLLCCTECGRLKGTTFSLTPSEEPLLVDPTEEDPWKYLDFDPATGNIVARFDVATNAETPKGIETVKVLQLDRREALATGYRRTFLRLSKVIQGYFDGEVCSAEEMVRELRTIDDHGLTDWCFLGTGRSVTPFLELHQMHSHFWGECEAIVRRLQEEGK